MCVKIGWQKKLVFGELFYWYIIYIKGGDSDRLF